jgi:hypothetical protein
MSERDEQGTSELERRLDAAFAGTRPRRGFEDELWARLQARRPWWVRLGSSPGKVRWGGVAAGLATLVLAGLVVTLVRSAGSPHGVSTASSGVASAPIQAPQPAPGAAGPSRSDTAGAALPFGRLPEPAAAGVLQVVRPSGPSALPIGAQGASVNGPSPPPPGLAVYRYDPATGPADGTILETNAVPAALSVGIYPSRPVADAVAAAEAGRASSQAVVLTQARLVYVAVVSGGRGFLEPAYLFTGSSGGMSVQLLESALAPSALQ